MDEPDSDLLTPRQRECVEAREECRTAKQIGRILGISHNTVFMHWRLARQRLRRVREQREWTQRQAYDPKQAPPADPDVLILLERIRSFGRHLFFWIGVVATAAFAIHIGCEGLLIMAGERVPVAQEGGCAGNPR